MNVTGVGTGAEPPTFCSARVTPGQLPTPTTQPIIDRNPNAGTFPAGRDVWVLQTYTNDLGETPAGPANGIVNTTANDGVQVDVSVPLAPDGSLNESGKVLGRFRATGIRPKFYDRLKSSGINLSPQLFQTVVEIN